MESHLDPTGCVSAVSVCARWHFHGVGSVGGAQEGIGLSSGRDPVAQAACATGANPRTCRETGSALPGDFAEVGGKVGPTGTSATA